ncbi:MAG: 23S rRNA (pseudouridine(1915)-N(3))-methyltransferase RlmH [bacterium]
MIIRLIAVGEKMPSWVQQGFQEYQRRLTGKVRLQLQEIPAAKRTKNAAVEKLKQQEADRILPTIPNGDRVIALEVKGREWSTAQLSRNLDQWMHDGRDISLVVGGPDGLHSTCQQRADQLWSLSPLTLPHPLVRIVVAEQLYRAHSILSNHPYHRG